MLPNKFRFVHQSKPMIKERLTTCETLLYRWLHFHQNQTKPEELNLQYFQVWTAEFLAEKASGEDIDQALLRLMQLRLIYLNDGGTLAIAPEEQPGVQMAPSPEILASVVLGAPFGGGQFGDRLGGFDGRLCLCPVAKHRCALGHDRISNRYGTGAWRK